MKVYYIEKYDELIIVLEDLVNVSEEFKEAFAKIVELGESIKADYIGEF